jgi:hypothetical protein
LSACAGREGLLASTSSGLVLLKWDASSRQLASTTPLTDSSWANASQLQTVVFGSTTKICGVASSGCTILYADWDGGQIVSSSVGSLTVSSTILSLAGLNWSGSSDTPHFDFAYDDGSKLRVVSSAGTTLYSYTNAYATPLVLRMPAASGTDNVIWVTKNPFGDGQVLTVAHSSNGSVESPIYGGTMVAARLTLADIDHDGLQDLVITRSDGPYAQVLYRQTSGSMSFGLTNSAADTAPTLNLSNVYGSCSTIAPAVAAGDLDGDGDEDLLFAGHAACGNEAFVWFSNAIDEEFSSVDHESDHIKPWVVDLAEFDDWTGVTQGTDNVAMLYFTPWLRPTAAPANSATDLRVTVWARASQDGPIEPQSLTDRFVSPSGSTTCAVAIPANFSGEFPQYLVVCFNYVKRDTSGAITNSYPSWVGQIDRSDPPQAHGPTAGGTTTGGIDRPPPPPSSPPPSP